MLFAIDYLANNKESEVLSRVENGNYNEYKQIEKRVRNGLILFGIYFQGLWD
jgi:hypothetical protein